jgi:hypothetical protein
MKSLYILKIVMRRQQLQKKVQERRLMSPEHFAVHMSGGGLADLVKKPFKLVKGLVPLALLAAELARAGTTIRGTENSQLGRIVHDPRLVRVETLARIMQRGGLL